MCQKNEKAASIYDDNWYTESSKNLTVVNIFTYSALTNKHAGFVLKLSLVLYTTNLHRIIRNG